MLLCIISPVIALITLYFYIKKEAYPKKLILLALLFLLGTGTLCNVVCHEHVQGLSLLAMAINICMLMITSYMDYTTGEFQLIILLIAIVAEGFIYLFGFFGKHGYASFVIMLISLVALVFAGLAVGDALIFVCCTLSFLTFDGYAVLMFMLMLAVSNGFAAIINIKKLFSKDERNKEFAFTTYIYIGYCVSFFLLHFSGA